MDGRIALLVEALDQAFDRRAWHGTTLKGSLRGLAVEDALWRPSPGRHNVWELLLHAAYWKYIVRRRVAKASGPAFAREPSNWPAPPASPVARDLGRDVAYLTEEHSLLRAAVVAFPGARLGATAGKGLTFFDLIHGAAAHDLYHTGQIQLIKRLRRG
jgi:hypothetical protein